MVVVVHMPGRSKTTKQRTSSALQTISVSLLESELHLVGYGRTSAERFSFVANLLNDDMVMRIDLSIGVVSVDRREQCLWNGNESADLKLNGWKGQKTKNPHLDCDVFCKGSQFVSWWTYWQSEKHQWLSEPFLAPFYTVGQNVKFSKQSYRRSSATRCISSIQNRSTVKWGVATLQNDETSTGFRISRQMSLSVLFSFFLNRSFPSPSFYTPLENV